MRNSEFGIEVFMENVRRICRTFFHVPGSIVCGRGKPLPYGGNAEERAAGGRGGRFVNRPYGDNSEFGIEGNPQTRQTQVRRCFSLAERKRNFFVDFYPA